MKACVIIPAFNESRVIGELINQVKALGLSVIVVDDGSSDNTRKIAESLQVPVICNSVNLGKGASLIKGYKYALTQGFEAVISMDGDGQHSIRDLPAFLDAAGNSPNSIFIGNRMLQTKDMPRLRLLTNRLMSSFISLLAGQQIPDSQCGFRLIKKELLYKLDLETSKFETESEILIKAARLGFKIESVPVSTIYGQQKSQINPLLDSLRFIRFVFTQAFRSKGRC